MAIYMYDAENVEFKFSRLRRHLKSSQRFSCLADQLTFTCSAIELKHNIACLSIYSIPSQVQDVYSIVHSLSSGKVEKYFCAACHAFTLHVGKLNRHCGSGLG